MLDMSTSVLLVRLKRVPWRELRNIRMKNFDATTQAVCI
jgi:hypothetical protein